MADISKLFTIPKRSCKIKERNIEIKYSQNANLNANSGIGEWNKWKYWTISILLCRHAFDLKSTVFSCGSLDWFRLRGSCMSCVPPVDPQDQCRSNRLILIGKTDQGLHRMVMVTVSQQKNIFITSIVAISLLQYSPILKFFYYNFWTLFELLCNI